MYTAVGELGMIKNPKTNVYKSVCKELDTR